MLGKLAQSDRYLVSRALKGDRDAFGRLVDRHLDNVHAVAYAGLGNPNDAEDIAQDAFLKAFEALPTLREPQRFGHWVVTIARNLCREHWRTRLVRESKTIPNAEPADPNEQLAQRDLHALLRQQLERIDETAREVLVLYYFSGRNTREIAALLGISTGAAKKRLERARRTLSEQFLAELDNAAVQGRSQTERSRILLTAIAAASPSWCVEGKAAAAFMSASGLLAAKLGAVAISAGLVAGGILAIGGADVAPAKAEPQRSPAPLNLPQIESPPLTVLGNAGDGDTRQDADSESNPEPAQQIAQASMSAQSGAAPADEVSGENRIPQVDLTGLRAQTEAVLETSVKIHAQNAPIPAIMDYLSETYGVNYVLAPPQRTEAYEIPDPLQEVKTHTAVTDGIVPYINLKDVKLWEALEALCRPLKLKAAAMPGYIYISTPQEIERQQEEFNRDEQAKAVVIAESNPVVSIEFEDVHLSEIVAFLSEYLEINFVIDYRFIERTAEMERQSSMTTVQVESIVETPTGPVAKLSIDGGAASLFREGERFRGGYIAEIDAAREIVYFRFESGSDATVGRKPGQHLTIPLNLPPPAAPLPSTSPSHPNLPYVSLKDVRLSEALESVLRPVNYHYAVGPGFVLVGPVNAVTRYKEGEVTLSEVPPDQAAALEKEFSFVAKDSKSVNELMELVATLTRGRIPFQEFAYEMRAPNICVYDAIPAAAILDGALGPLGLSWKWERGRMAITQPN